MGIEGSIIGKLLETDLSKKSTGVRVFQFISPWILWLILAASSALFFYTVQNWESARNLLYVWWFYMIPPMGKEVIIPKTLAETHHPPALVVALTTSVVDMILSLFLIWNYDWVKRLPVLGPKLEETEERGRERIEKTNWFSRVSFVATSMFVMVPFSGAGGVGGTVFGRLMGVKPYKVLLAVFIGSTIEALAFALLADSLMVYLEGSSFFVWFSNINILQIFAAFVMLGLILYVVRHPKEAVKRSSEVARKTIEISEKALIRSEGLSRKGREFSVMSSEEIIDDFKDVYDDVLDSIPHVLNDRVSIVDGNKGLIFSSLRKMGIDVLKGSGDFTSKKMKEGVRTTGKGTDTAVDLFSKATLVGLHAVKDGIDEGEYLILLVEDRVESVVKIPEKIIKK